MPITKDQLSKINRQKAYRRLFLMNEEEKEALKEKQRQGMRKYWQKAKQKLATEATNTVD